MPAANALSVPRIAGEEAFKGLTLKQQKFCLNYLQSGNATDACRKAGYNVTTDGSARAVAHETLSNANVQRALNELVAISISPSWILSRLRHIATSSEQDNNRVKSLELLGKHHKLWGDAAIQADNIVITLGSVKPQDAPQAPDLGTTTT